MGLDIVSAVRDVQSPAYVFSGELFEERAKLVKEAFGDKVDICYSIKANPFLLNMLPSVFSKVEVCSPGELEICKALAVDPKKIIFSGVNKNYSEIEAAVDYSVKTITAESRLHFEAINKLGEAKGEPIKVLLRLTSDSQFGMDREVLLDLCSRREEYKGVNIVGLHYFSGTQKRGHKENAKELEKLKGFLLEITEKTGLTMESLEYGAGLSASYFTTDQEAQETEINQLEEVAPYIRDMAEIIHVTVEMGRFFAAPSGFYISEVVDTKTNDGINYAILDGGAHQLKYDGQLGGMLVPCITKIGMYDADSDAGSDAKVDADQSQEWTLAGSLCTTQDIIARNVPLGELKPGDRLIFHRAGAYSVTEGIALFLSRDLPSVYGIKPNGELELFRERIETFGFNMPRK